MKGPPPGALSGQVCVYAVTPPEAGAVPACLQLGFEEARALFVEGVVGVFLVRAGAVSQIAELQRHYPSGTHRVVDAQ